MGPNSPPTMKKKRPVSLTVGTNVSERLSKFATKLPGAQACISLNTHGTWGTTSIQRSLPRLSPCSWKQASYQHCSGHWACPHSDRTHNPPRYSPSDVRPSTDKGQQGVSNGGGRGEEVLGEFVLVQYLQGTTADDVGRRVWGSWKHMLLHPLLNFLIHLTCCS